MRLYARHFSDSRACEAPGCRLAHVRTLYRVGSSLLRACCRAHAEEADQALRGVDRRRSPRAQR